MLSTLEISASKDKMLSLPKLRERMMQLCRDRELPYGIIVRKVLNQNILATTLYTLTEGDFPFARNQGQVSALEIYKLYANGREELVRGGEIAGVAAQSFKDILATGDRKFAYNCLAMPVTPAFFTGGAQFIPTSVITPALLFEDLEVRPIEDDFTKPPILPHPFFSSK